MGYSPDSARLIISQKHFTHPGFDSVIHAPLLNTCNRTPFGNYNWVRVAMIPGWLNTDIEPNDKEVYLDATGRYPFPDGSFQYVFSEHMIEHVPWEAAVMMLRECHRVLAKGGKLRIVTPNLAKFIQLLDGNPDAAAVQFIDAKVRFNGGPITPIPGAYILNRQVREYGHQFLYDPPTLRKSLELAGFREIKQYEVTDITDPVFQAVESRTRHPDADMRLTNSWESMAFEAGR